MSDMQHSQWKLKELTILTEASLKVITDINPVKCTDAQRVHLEVLKDNMELSRTLFDHVHVVHLLQKKQVQEQDPDPDPDQLPHLFSPMFLMSQGMSLIIMILLLLQ